MKKKYKISESRILQISNDITDNTCDAKRQEILEVVKFWRDEFDKSVQERMMFHNAVIGELLRFTKVVSLAESKKSS